MGKTDTPRNPWKPGDRVAWAGYADLFPGKLPVQGDYLPVAAGTVLDIFDTRLWKSTRGLERPEEVREHVVRARMAGRLLDTVPVRWDAGGTSLAPIDELYPPGQVPHKALLKTTEAKARAQAEKPKTTQASKTKKGKAPAAPQMDLGLGEWERIPMTGDGVRTARGADHGS